MSWQFFFFFQGIQAGLGPRHFYEQFRISVSHSTDTQKMFFSIFIHFHISGIIIKLINSSWAWKFQIHRSLHLDFPSSSGSMCLTWSLSRSCHVSPLDTLHLEGGTFPVLRETHAENTVQGKSRRGLSPSSAPPQLAELGQTMAEKSFSLPILCHCCN